MHVDAFFNDLEKRRGNVDEAVGILGPAFDQQDLVRGIFGETGRKHASGRAAANDDEVEPCHGAFPPCRRHDGSINRPAFNRIPSGRW